MLYRSVLAAGFLAFASPAAQLDVWSAKSEIRTVEPTPA